KWGHAIAQARAGQDVKLASLPLRLYAAVDDVAVALLGSHRATIASESVMERIAALVAARFEHVKRHAEPHNEGAALERVLVTLPGREAPEERVRRAAEQAPAALVDLRSAAGVP